MQTSQPRTSRFDTRSVLLFAALTLGGMGALQAQTSAPPPQGSGSFSSGPQTGPQASAASSAFDRADTDKDGQLSMQEAARLPAISQRFKEFDTDGNGTLSRAEFEKAVQR